LALTLLQWSLSAEADEVVMQCSNGSTKRYQDVQKVRPVQAEVAACTNPL
jgi:hypothetical protein